MITNQFLAQDGTALDVRFINHDSKKGTIIFWPCTSGDAGSRLYQIPQDLLTEKGYSIVLYNPRGHGKSEGDNHLYQGAEDLMLWLGKMLPRQQRSLPIIGVGHSAGGAGILKAASLAGNSFSKLFVASPILSSRESLYYMYERGSIDVFLGMFESVTPNPSLTEMLRATDWLESERWVGQDLKSRFNYPLTGIRRISFNSVGQFLENIAQPGHDVYEALEQNKAITHIFLPSDDKWFPKTKTVETAEKLKVSVSQPISAKDHFFKHAWGEIWDYVLKRLP